VISIGIETHQGLVYEGASGYGRAIWPVPVITPAKIVFASEGLLEAESSSNSFGGRFREDYYDPISRIRRGRFYFASGSQPQEWRVHAHPAMPFETKPPNIAGVLVKRLETFQGQVIWHKYIKDHKEQPLVLLGADDRFTVWSIINVEAITTGEDLVTLKARSSLGILPEINAEDIPQLFRHRVEESLSSFTDEVHRSPPLSVIDRARDAASQLLLAYFGLEGAQSRDLGELAKKLDREERTIAASSAKIIARLHARGKPVERQKRDLRAIREQDAELAVQCVGALICELGWGEWR
jgi:hypothetical protein